MATTVSGHSLFAVSPIASIATTVSGHSLFAVSPIARSLGSDADDPLATPSSDREHDIPVFRVVAASWRAA